MVGDHSPVVARWRDPPVRVTCPSVLPIGVDLIPFTNWFYYIDVARWWRVGYLTNPETGKIAFRPAAARGWAAPQIAYGAKIAKSVPNFTELQHVFTAAQPMMRRVRLPTRR